MKRNLELFFAGLVALISTASVIGAYFILPYRVNAIEKRQDAQAQEIKDVRDKAASDHDILVRIEQQTTDIQSTLVQMQKRNNPNL